MKIFSKPVYGALSSLPFATMVLFYLLVLRVTLLLGHVPQPSRPDPSTLHLPIHMALVTIGLSLSFTFILPLAILALYSQIKKLSIRTEITYAFIFNMICALTLWVLALLDPGHLWGWFFD